MSLPECVGSLRALTSLRVRSWLSRVPIDRAILASRKAAVLDAIRHTYILDTLVHVCCDHFDRFDDDDDGDDDDNDNDYDDDTLVALHCVALRRLAEHSAAPPVVQVAEAPLPHASLHTQTQVTPPRRCSDGCATLDSIIGDAWRHVCRDAATSLRKVNVIAPGAYALLRLL